MSDNLANLAAPPAANVFVLGNMAGKTNFLLWFVIIFVILILLTWWLAPAFVLKKTLEGEPIPRSIDWGKAILYSIIIDLIIVLLIYLLSGSKAK